MSEHGKDNKGSPKKIKSTTPPIEMMDNLFLRLKDTKECVPLYPVFSARKDSQGRDHFELGPKIATREELLAVVAAGKFKHTAVPVKVFGPGQELAKKQYLERYASDFEYEGVIWAVCGPGYLQGPRAPEEGWWRGQQDIEEALIEGGYLKSEKAEVRDLNYLKKYQDVVDLKDFDVSEEYQDEEPETLAEGVQQQADGEAEAGEAIEPEAEAEETGQAPDMGAAALYYAQARKWHVFPLWRVKDDGTCACGNPKCKDVGKHPIGLKGMALHGFKDATRDEATIRRWWRQFPQASIGIACGPSKLLVIDKDMKPGKDGFAAWETLKAKHGDPGITLCQVSGSGGEHEIFDRSGYDGYIKCSDSPDGLDLRADRGYIVATPSNHVSGNRYHFPDASVPIAPAPQWLCEWAANREKGGRDKKKQEKTSHQEAASTSYSPGEEARLISALKFIPALCRRQGLA